MRDLFALAVEPRFANDHERQFCMRSIERIETANARTWYYASIVFWFFTLLVAFNFPFEPILKFSLAGATSALILIKLSAVITIRNGNYLRYGQLAGFILSNAVLAAACFAHSQIDSAYNALLLLWAAGGILALGVLAFRNRVHIMAVIFFLGIFGSAVWQHPNGLLIGSFTAIMALTLSNAQIFFKRYVKLELINSYRQQSAYTPRQVLLQAIEHQVEVTDLFKPGIRKCVCICSDWRSFQAFSNQVSTSTLADTLEAFYNLQIKLLDESFPEGNYFIDWIADELFVAAYETESQQLEDLVLAAYNYGKASLATRPEFFSEHQAPHGLDIGIAAGETTIGMLGPAGNKKATALGRIPGLSRRLQTVGKNLRQAFDVADRIVMAGSLSEIFTGHTEIEATTLPAAINVKDLDSSAVLLFTNRDKSPETQLKAS